MNFSPKEQTFILRGLDKASTETEAVMCAAQLFKLLRERNVNGYDLMGGQQNNSHQTQNEPPKDDGYEFYSEGFGWGRGRGRWGKWADGSTYWEDEHGYKHGPPNPRRRNGNGSSATTPQPDRKWDFIREQRKQAPQGETQAQREAREQRSDFMSGIHSEYMDRNRKLARIGLYTFRAGATLLGLLALGTGDPLFWLAFIGLWIYCGCIWFYKHHAKKFWEDIPNITNRRN